MATFDVFGQIIDKIQRLAWCHLVGIMTSKKGRKFGLRCCFYLFL